MRRIRRPSRVVPGTTPAEEIDIVELALVDPSTNVHLQGRFAPVHEEIDADDLVVEGELPAGLEGAYVRNGPNPRLPPLGSYTYPMEGDAMLHGVWLEGGKARYRNRWVVTAGMQAELDAGRALFGGLMTPAFVDTDLLGPDPDPGWPFKLDPFINIVHHGGRWLALEEGSPPYEVDAALETVGRYDFGGALPKGMCAHPKIDPTTGEMFLFRYDVEAPFLTWAVVGPDGTVTRPETVIETVDVGHMIHDCVLTDRHLVLVVAPVIFDLDAMMSGGDVLRWDETLPARIAVIDRISGAIRWIETDPFFVWHYGNGYETDDGEIVVDFAWWDRFDLAPVPHQGGFARMTLDPDAGSAAIHMFDDRPTEFPRIDERLTGRPHRYVAASRKSGRFELPVGEFDQLVRHDVQTGDVLTHDAEGCFGEVTFAPRAGGTDELDGWYLAFTSSMDAKRSWLSVWDAADFPGDPVAKVHVPQRVPNGLHGGWFPA